ncbi:MAG: adenosylmethionine--8-amino-7-oxononanoate transaminase [Candidatus Omnitrophica bacterium]|nr:adenosylmethionine--8-amino-7-oxononanoate transaminase [Candidatus Omnitrophota bacterium]
MKPYSKQLIAWDKKYAWHPFTQMRDWIRDDGALVIERGQGSYLIDSDGRRYLDGVSSLWCNTHGHRVPVIDRAVKRQLGKIAHSTYLGLANEPASILSKELIGIAPKGLTKVFYSDSGSEAVEIALKMAYQYWQLKGVKTKRTFLKFTNAYHGDTVGSVSVGGIQLFHDIFGPLLFKTFAAAAPYRYRDNFEGSEDAYAKFCADRVERELKRHHRQIAAIVLEPLAQGAAGMLTQPKGFLKRVAALAKKYNTLLILDEVATGFGRTGTMFACEQEGVNPDLLCLAKGLTAGYLPLAATLATDKIYNAFLGRYDEFKTFFHGHTYTANPLACAAAVANLKYFKEKRVLHRAQGQIRLLTQELKKIEPHPNVGEIRQVGMMVGIELVQDKATRNPFKVEAQIGAKVCKEARKYGILIRPLGNVIVLMPPFCFTEAQIMKLCSGVYRAIKVVLRAEELAFEGLFARRGVPAEECKGASARYLRPRASGSVLRGQVLLPAGRGQVSSRRSKA